MRLHFFIILLGIIISSCHQNKKKTKDYNENNPQKTVDSLLMKAQEQGFRGSVVFVKENDVILNETFGDLTSNLETSYWIGSITKQFTAAAILKLQETGKLSVKDSLVNFFDTIPKDKKGITIHHLLTHTSGLDNNYVVDGITDRNQAISIILNSTLKYDVGYRYSYSAEGYNLLAIIVEMVSGTSYENYITNEIIMPLSLDKTGFWGFENLHEIKLAKWNEPSLSTKFMPTVFSNGKSKANFGYKGSTGIFSTSQDLWKWTKSLRDDTFLKTNSKKAMLSPHILIRTKETDTTSYGYGWVIKTTDGKTKQYRHAGAEDGGIGHNGIIRFSDDYLIIILSNSGTYKEKGPLEGVEWSTVLSHELLNILEKNK